MINNTAEKKKQKKKAVLPYTQCSMFVFSTNEINKSVHNNDFNTNAVCLFIMWYKLECYDVSFRTIMGKMIFKIASNTLHS